MSFLEQLCFIQSFQLIKYLCVCLLNKYYRNCGGHHDSDRVAVLVMVSKAESIVLQGSILSKMSGNPDGLLGGGIW